MSDILRLESLDLKTLFISVFVILAAINGIVKVVGEFSKIINKPFKWVQAQNKDTEAIKTLAQKQIELEQQILNNKADSLLHDQDLNKRIDDLGDKLNKLTDIVVDDRVDRMRYEILDMASAISESKRWYSVEQLKHTLKVYDEYEKFLREHKLENGEVDLSIQIIREAYKSKYAGMGNI